MTKEELEEKIKNNESVFDKNGEVIDFTEYEEARGDCGRFARFVKFRENGVQIVVFSDYDYEYFYKFNEIFSTKEQAKHFLNNSNVTRTEKLPYVTWEEFKNGKEIKFIEPKGAEVLMFMGDYICVGLDYNAIFRERATEENFYKAYEVCRKLFEGEEL